MKETLLSKIALAINIIALILILFVFIMMLFSISNDDNYKCYLTTRGYICVWGSDKE